MRNNGTLCFLLIVGIHTCLLAWGAFRHSPNWDEIGHLPSGIHHWHTGSFGMYEVNPPLVRMVAALPIAICAQPSIDWISPTDGPGVRPEFSVGTQFLAANLPHVMGYFAVARCACIPFSWLGAWVCFSWTRRLYGVRSALVAVTLWCFSPNILGHGQMLTPAVGATATGLLSNYLFWRWLKSPAYAGSIVLGIVLGLTELTKTSWIILYPLWPCLCICLHHGKKRLFEDGLQLTVAFTVSIYIINAAYCFEGSLTRLGDYEFVSTTLSGERQTRLPSGSFSSGNRFRNSVVAAMPVPFPRSYIQGIDMQKLDFEQKYMSYLRGEWRHGGWWYFYLYAMAIKLPLGTCLLIGSASCLRLRDFRRGTDDAVLLVPGISLLVLVSSQTGFNHHLRYVLPLFPALFILAGYLFSARSAPWLRRFAGVALGWAIISSLWIWPHSLSYFNETIGGPSNGHWHLGGTDLDTNIDCGQDLLYLKEWLDRAPALPTTLAFSGAVDPEAVGIVAAEPLHLGHGREKSMPPHRVIVSVNQLHRRDERYLSLLREKPTASIGYSIRIFQFGWPRKSADKTPRDFVVEG